MKRYIASTFAASLLVAAPLTLAAQPTFQMIGEVNIAAHGITPTDIAYHDGDLFISCFAANRQIVRISNALTTDPTVSTFAVTAGPDSGGVSTDPPPTGPITFQAGRGLTSLTVHPDGRVMVAGDAGNPNDGWTGAVVLEYDSEGNLLRQITVPDPFVPDVGDSFAFNRLNAARYFGDNGVLIAGIFGVLFHANDDLDTLISPYRVGGHPNFTRGIAFVDDTIFLRTTSNQEDKLQRYLGGTLGSLENYEWEQYEFAQIGPQTFNTSSGIQTFEHQAGETVTTYVVANKASAPVAVQFYDPAGEVFSTPAFSLETETLGVGQLLALGFATTDDGQYMLLGRVDSPGGSNTIQIYGIDGAQLIVPPVGELGDINGDGVINVADVTELANLVAAGTPPPVEVGDINQDGSVDEADVAALANLIVDGE